MQHSKKQVTHGRTYLKPSLKGRRVIEGEVLSHPETAEHTDRRVQMLHLTLRELFPSSSPPQDFSLTFIQKIHWGEGGSGRHGKKYRKPKRCEKTEGEKRRSPPVRPVWRAHRGEHPLQQSKDPRRERRGGEEERQAKQSWHSLLLLLLQEQNPGTGFWI